HILFSGVPPNGKTVLTSRFRKDSHSLVEVWDLAERTRLRSFPIESCGEYQEFTTDPSGKTLCVGGANTPELRFYDIATGQRQIPPDAPAAFTDAYLKRIAALPVAEQIQEVREELKKRNPKFDGELIPTVENGEVTGLRFLTDRVSNISPVRALGKLSVLE